MHIARPASGFFLHEEPTVVSLIAAESKKFPRLPQAWKDIKARLAMTGHREGIAVDSRINGTRLWIFHDPQVPDIPKVRVAYSCLGEDLTIIAVCIG